MGQLSWVEISRSALENNIMQFRKITGKETLLCPCVKANAYGHGLVEVSKVFLQSGADWLCVNSVDEAQLLRYSGVESPILILGYVPLKDIGTVLELDCRIVVYNTSSIDEIAIKAMETGLKPKVHVKVETGCNRQGVAEKELPAFVRYIKQTGVIEIEGVLTHFANIEDTTDHSYAEHQAQRFNHAVNLLESEGIKPTLKHCANSAATILFPEFHFQMVRFGISGYGLWPSNETLVSFKQQKTDNFKLIPALTWKTRIAQIKTVPQDSFIGYGCTYKTSHETRLAVLPVGYYDGYDRGISGGFVLINGQRAPIRGRICMNIMMVEVTDVSEAGIEDEVVLIGRSGDDCISAEMFAAWAGTINYEVTTRINERIPRIIV